jgi:hypothetical protein
MQMPSQDSQGRKLLYIVSTVANLPITGVEGHYPEAIPYPLPAGSRLLQDLGFLAFTLPQVEILMPIKQPRGEELTREQRRAHQALTQRRLRIEHVNSSVKRCRIVKDRIRLWKEGVRDLVMELCCALHNFRVRLTPWQAMG